MTVRPQRFAVTAGSNGTPGVRRETDDREIGRQFREQQVHRAAIVARGAMRDARRAFHLRDVHERLDDGRARERRGANAGAGAGRSRAQGRKKHVGGKRLASVDDVSAQRAMLPRVGGNLLEVRALTEVERHRDDGRAGGR